ncbi:MAG: hypothetical protein ACFFAA_14170 [Promethearchaeota archaeon]
MNLRELRKRTLTNYSTTYSELAMVTLGSPKSEIALPVRLSFGRQFLKCLVNFICCIGSSA